MHSNPDRKAVMTQKDFEFLARYLGGVLGRAYVRGGEKARTLAYTEAYEPLANMLADENPRFDRTRFSSAVATHEQNYVGRV
jgi:hypothetical protein